MNRLVIALALIVATRGASGKPIPPAAPPAPDPEHGNFWRDLVEPHKTEIDAIMAKAHRALEAADQSLFGDYDPTGEARERIYHEVFGMLRYAHRLAPDNVDVLRLYGVVADKSGKTREAIEALRAVIDRLGADQAGIEATGRLGTIYLRLGRLDDAIRYLRLAQGPIAAGNATTATVLVHLSNALAARGQMAEAIDVLVDSLPTNPPYYTNEMTLVSFALAVQYDRDEQHGAAFEILDRMAVTQQGALAAQIQNELATMRYAPAADQHYYNALLYEISGNYVEARAEWALYAAAGDLPYRRRALDHVATIDALHRAPLAPPTSQVRRHQIRPMVPATP